MYKICKYTNITLVSIPLIIYDSEFINNILIKTKEMKKFNLLFILASICTFTNAQVLYTPGGNIGQTSSGNNNLGIGLNNPAQKLEIYNLTSVMTVTQFGNSTTGSGASNGFLVGIESAGNGYIWNRENSYLRLGTNNAERMRILANGNVGIGTTSPREKLEVAGTILSTKMSIGAGGEFSSIDKLVVYENSSNHVSIQLSNTVTGTGEGNGFVMGVRSAGDAFIWHRGNEPMCFGTNSIERMRILANGYIGVGTETPREKLDVAGTILSTKMKIGAGGEFSSIDKLVIYENSSNHVSIQLSNTVTGTGEGNGFVMGVRGTGDVFIWHRENKPMCFGTNAIERMRILANGYIGVGTETPREKLEVAGTIRATEIKVLAQTADFVFEDDYELRSLNEVESFINDNGHLPDIPSATEMEKDGIGLAEMNKLLLQKIEELTLYMIELEKRVEKQEQKNK